MEGRGQAEKLPFLVWVNSCSFMVGRMHNFDFSAIIANSTSGNEEDKIVLVTMDY